MKAFRSTLLVSCAILSIAGLRATTVVPPTFDELVDQAEIIFQGGVTDVRSQWIGEGAEHRIETFVTFKIDDAIKGAPGGTYTIRMLGGTVDGQTMEVTDTPKFKVGDRDILFVEHNGSQFVPLVGIMHGRFRVQQDDKSGREIVAKNDGTRLTDVTKLGKDEPAAVAPRSNTNAVAASGLTTAEFKSSIRAKLARGTP